MIDACPGELCALRIVSWVYDPELGCVVAVLCTVHERVHTGADAPVSSS